MNVRELLGKIIIQENVSPIDTNKIRNTFVVHIPNPLATYYTRFSEINRPNSILFITKKAVSFEKILRATQKINASNDVQLDGAKCEMNIGSRKHSGIRVKGIHRFSNIEKIQNLYKDQGFEFAKAVRINDETDSLTRVNKFFFLNDVSEGIYQSPNNKNRFYIEIPEDMSWNKFRDLTFDVKNNISVTNFDVAKGMFYINDGIIDVVRIIKPDITLDMVKEIQQKYLGRLR